MHVVIIILTVIVAILLILIVLIQKSKGGGLSSQFGGAGTMMGVRQTNSFLENATWTLVGLLALLSVISAFTAPKNAATNDIRVAPEATAPATLPAAGQTDATVVPVAAEDVTVEDVTVTETPATAPEGEGE